MSSAAVAVDGETIGALDRPGLVVLLGVARDDTAERARRLAAKIHQLRIMRDDRSAADASAPLLVVSQFTLYADTTRGRRPSWSAAAPGELAEPLVEAFVQALRATGAEVATGRFGADMQVSLVNDGPVTLVVEA